jgi:trehalose 6-phosphate synthase
MSGAMEAPTGRIVVASNRGPASFAVEDDGTVVARPGAGGLATVLDGALASHGGLWIAAAMTEDERRAADGTIPAPSGRYDVRLLAFDPAVYDGFYNGIANRVLWFLHHLLWDTPTSPSFGAETWSAWEAYRTVNGAFADVLAGEGDDPAFLVQDYHLSLVPAMLRSRRPEASIAWFSHTPFAGAHDLRILPEPMRRALLEGLLGADVVGFHAEPWAANFREACRTHLGTEVDDRGAIRWEGRRVSVGVFPISIDTEGLSRLAGTPEVDARLAELDGDLGPDVRLVLRVDRLEPSKNVVRGLEAFALFLDARPRWRGRVRFLALLNPSREAVPEYRAYLEACREAARAVDERFGTETWHPVELRLRDDRDGSLAGYRRFDVLVVNPTFDGMNLVAKEGPWLNERDGVLVLSTNAGAATELGEGALLVDPFDVRATAEAIGRALDMAPEERARRAGQLRDAVAANRLEGWVSAQLRALGRG